MVLSPLRLKYIERLLVLLKMQFLSMKTARRARCQWLYCLCLLIHFLGGCASATGRKKGLFRSSNQPVESSEVGGSSAVSPLSALPIGPDEVTKFPHLAPFRGNLLLAREALQVVVSGEQNSWTSVSGAGLVPLVVGVFEAQVVRGKKTFVRNPAMDGVMLRVECSKQCSPGFSVRLEGVEEIASDSSPEDGVSGISLTLVASERDLGDARASRGSEDAKKSVAQVRIQVGGDGPGIFVEALPTVHLRGRLAIEPVTGAGQNLLAVPEGNLIEGGDSKRLSYVQVEASGGQFLILPAPSSSVTLEGGVNGEVARVEAAKSPIRSWFYVGDRAVQNGFRAALEQEVGAPFGVQELKFDSSVADAGSLMMADSWLANDSGDPLLLLNLGRKPVLRLPVEAHAAEETPLPFVLRLAGVQAGAGVQKIAGKLLKVESESLEQVSFYGQPVPGNATADQGVQMPDMIAVAPLGSQAEQRRLFMRVVAGDGVSVVGAGIIRAQNWPIRMQLPQGVYEALFFKQSRGLICRVPFDVSRQRRQDSIPPVACGVAQRMAQPARLPSLADVMVTPADGTGNGIGNGNSFASVRNQRLGVEFGISPAGDEVAAGILQDIGKSDLDDAEIGRRVLPSGKRVVLLPCPIDSGVIENLRQTPLASNETTFALPVRRCSSNLQSDSWDRIEQMKAMGLNGVATAPLAKTGPLGSLGAGQYNPSDAVFPMEPVVRHSGAQVLGRAGTYISVDAARRLDANRVELTVKIGRASNISRFQNLAWGLRSLRVISRGAILSEARIQAGAKEYKMTFRMNAKNPIPVRVDLLGRFQGILASAFHAPDDFVVAETQLLDVK